MPGYHLLIPCSRVGLHVFAQIHEVGMAISVVIQNTQMAGVQKVTIFGITKVYDPTFLGFSFRICHQNEVATEVFLHTANSIEGHEAIRQIFGLVVPFLPSIVIIREIGRKPVGDQRHRA